MLYTAWCVPFGTNLLSDVLSAEKLIPSQLSPSLSACNERCCRGGLMQWSQISSLALSGLKKVAINLWENIKPPKWLKINVSHSISHTQRGVYPTPHINSSRKNLFMQECKQVFLLSVTLEIFFTFFSLFIIYWHKYLSNSAAYTFHFILSGAKIVSTGCRRPCSLWVLSQ